MERDVVAKKQQQQDEYHVELERDVKEAERNEMQRGDLSVIEEKPYTAQVKCVVVRPSMRCSSVASTTTSTTLRHHSFQGVPPSHYQPRHTKHKAANTTASENKDVYNYTPL
ncbi:hypothetical protein Pmani_033622 [Petrolisthes manimaculis]|uniref:Uncharacterized protein n=1 Tax=Petrolisthes manimaculis TaxID=1843537 RepID=A0AAE1NQW3_9EUCA|nr:hypothetical protein Pmani_033622 [Petrolisthes manimaculis]